MARATFFLKLNPDAPTPDLSGVLAIPGVWQTKKNARVLCAPDHAAWIVERKLFALGVAFGLKADPPEPQLAKFPDLPALRAPGGDTPPLTPYQRRFVQRFATRPGSYLYWAAGAGKTAAAIAWALYGKGLTVVVTRAAARVHWAAEIARYTTVRSLILTGDVPRGELFVDEESLVPSGWALLTLFANAKTSNLATWASPARIRRYIETAGPVPVITAVTATALATRVVSSAVAVRKQGTLLTLSDPIETAWDSVPFLIVGLESLPAHIELLLKLPVTSVIWDEIHKLSAHRRAIAVYGDNGEISFKSRENIAASAALLAKHAKRRVAASATPLSDRLRNLWAQLDLVEPFQWGVFGGPGARPGFTGRYANACAGKFTTWDTSGTGSKEMLAELQARLSFMMDTVTKAESHGALPPMRRIVTRIPEEDLDDAPPEMMAELSRVARERPSMLPETRTALAASKKRSFTVALVDAALEAGQKVAVFTARRRDCKALAEAVGKLSMFRKKAPPKLWWGHGEVALVDREQMRSEFMEHPGPCVLVGTGEAYGESINLNDCDLALIVMLPLNVRQLRQWEGRFLRLGSTRSVIINYVIAEGTTDERIAEILLDKLPASEAVLGDSEMGEVARAIAYGGREDEIERELFDALTKGTESDE